MERKNEKRTFGKKESSRKSDNFVNNSNPDNKQKFDRSEKKERPDQPYKSKFDKKEDKPYGKSKFGEHSDKPRYGDKPKYGETKEKSFGKKTYGDRDSKPSFRDRPENPYGKPSNRDKDEKPYGKPSFRSKDDKPYGKPSFRGKDDKPYGKPSFRERDEKSYSKPSFYNKDEKPYSKPSFHDRDEKPYGKIDKSELKSYFSKDKEFDKDSPKPIKRIHHKIEKPYIRAKTMNEEAPLNEDSGTSRKPRKRTSEINLPRRDRPRRAEVLELKNFKDTNRYEEGSPMRLNKYIANAGICSRREADTLISSGVVSINGVIITEMGTKVNPGDMVQYDGSTLVSERKKYILLNKPKGYITTTDDPQERRTVMALISNACKERVYPVGRLDRNTSGVLLFTNDGDLAKKLTHPKHGAKKIYHVELDRPLTKADMDKIYAGVELEDGMVYVDEIAYIEDSINKKEVGVEIHSGKNRIIRRIFESLNYEVVKLDRVMFAGLSKKDISRGMWRFLTDQEISFLKMLK